MTSLARGVLAAIISIVVIVAACASSPAPLHRQTQQSRAWYSTTSRQADSVPVALPVALPAPGRMLPRVDPAALQLLRDVGETLHRATSLRAQTWTEMRLNPLANMPSAVVGHDAKVQIQTSIRSAEVRYLRPNYVWRDVTIVPDSGTTAPPSHNITLCTPGGTTGIEWRSGFRSDSYDQYRCKDSGDEAFFGFFDPTSEKMTYTSAWDTTGKTLTPLLRSLTLVGKETWRGATYDIVEAVYGTAYMQPEDTIVMTRRLYISPDHLIRRMITTDNKGSRTDHQVLSLELSVPMAADDFRWAPPDSVRVHVISPPRPAGTIGKPFPTLDLTATWQDGRTTTLRHALSGKQGAILWYWATTCEGCIMEFPHLEQLYRAVRGKGIEIIALDPMQDSPAGDSLEVANAAKMRDFWGTTIPIVLDRAVTHTMVENGVNYMIVDATGTVIDAGISMNFRAMYRTVDSLAAR